LAGKKALFDVTVLEASKRSLPEVTDEFANEVRTGLTAESLRAELQKAVDSEDAKEYAPARNAAIAKALAQVLDVEVPDTLVTKQAREKFAMMMTDMRNGGVSDEEIKKQISPENFLKYKEIVKDDITKDFKVSMATDEIARLEGIEVPDHLVQEQMEAIKQEAAESKEDFDEGQYRTRVEATLRRQAVMDYLADHAELEVQFVNEDGEFDEALMEKLASESLAREEELAGQKDEPGVPLETSVIAEMEQTTTTVVAGAKTTEPSDDESLSQEHTIPSKRDMGSMSLEEKAYYALLDAGALNQSQDT
jgi:trigger factor